MRTHLRSHDERRDRHRGGDAPRFEQDVRVLVADEDEHPEDGDAHLIEGEGGWGGEARGWSETAVRFGWFGSGSVDAPAGIFGGARSAESAGTAV
jgi:hypothetical protein